MLLVNRDQDLKIHHITNLEQNVRFFAHSRIYPFKNAVLIFTTTCNAYINLVTEYEATQMWSENGTIFHVYKPLHGKSGSSLCLGFVPDTTEPKPKILVYNLDQNCQINRQKRKVISSTQTLLLYEGR